jgi:hypothetical protein
MKGWTAEERKALEDEKLTTNPYTRFFTLRQTKDSLRLTFDEDENVVSDLPPKVFKDQMKRIVRDFLIPDPQTHRPRCDTRTDPGNYFAEFNAAYAAPRGRAPAKTAQATHAAAPINTSATGSVRPKAPRASVFFENLECHVQDDKLIKLTLEISKINHTRMTIAASLLTRAIFECALVYKLKKEKKWQGLINAEGKDPGLNEIVKFCGNFKNGVFAEQNICRTLQSHTTHQAKNYLDAITHMKYQEADSLTLESVANNLRQVIQHILMGN